MDRGEIQGIWPRHTHRVLRRAVSHAEGAVGGAAGMQRREWERLPDEIHGETRRAQLAGGSHFQSEVRAIANVQCVLAGWRCYRAAGLRELRNPGGLRATGKARR